MVFVMPPLVAEQTMPPVTTATPLVEFVARSGCEPGGQLTFAQIETVHGE